MWIRLRKPKSLWGWTFAVFVAGILLVLAANEIAIVVTTRRLDARLAALRADGKPTTFAEMLGPPIPEERNAAVPLARAAEKADRMFAAYMSTFGANALTSEADLKGTAALATAAEQDPSYETDLRKADSLPEYRCITELTEPEPTAVYTSGTLWRNLYRVEWVRSRRRRHEGRPVEAADLMLRLYRLSLKRMLSEPFIASESGSRAAEHAAREELNKTLQNFTLPERIYTEIESLLADEERVRNDQTRAIESQRPLMLQMHN